jgi:hypothetical protein
MAQVTITQLPQAQPLAGTESVPISQNGQTVQTTVAAIANSPTQQQTFITVNTESTLPNSRRLQGGTGVGLTDTGALGSISIILNGASGSLETSVNGMISKTSGNTVVGRTLTGSSTGVTVTNGDGVAGNPVIALNGPVGSINGLSGSGILVLQNSSSVGAVQITGTAGEVTVTDGNGLLGNPTISLDASGVAAGTYGSGTQVGQFAVDSKGRITSATNVTITGSENVIGGAANQILYQLGPNSTSFTVAPTSADTFLKWDGSGFVWGAIAGAGTVTSVDGSGGTTGLTVTGGPITSSGTLTLGGTLIVANGGTGATSLTGYVKGNGSSAFTAAATIPNTDITGLGTMSTQAASSVAIAGGNINGTTIGGTTPAAGTFTSVAMTTGTITTPPSSGNDIVNKTYADAIASGINFHESCKYATTAALAANTYNNGTSGVGATLTGNVNGALTVDGYTFASPADNGTRILVKNESNAAHNGVYTLSAAGSAGGPYILIRATDFDTAGTGVDQINQGDFFLIVLGTANANTSWVQQTPLPITVGTTGITFTQFGAPLTYSAGTGLSESPAYTFNIANTGVTSGSYGGAATAMTLSINAQGQITSATDVSIAIAASQITSGTIDSARISGSYTGITGVNTLTAGTWNANTITPAYGGTGLTSYTAGDIIYASGTATISKLALGATTYVLVAGAAAPEYVAQSTLSVGSATTATNATNVGTTSTTTNADFFIPFVAASTTGNQALGVDAGITYNPSTNAITAGISGGTF